MVLTVKVIIFIIIRRDYQCCSYFLFNMVLDLHNFLEEIWFLTFGLIFFNLHHLITFTDICLFLSVSISIVECINISVLITLLGCSLKVTFVWKQGLCKATCVG